jgi:hypothetical protein
MRRRLDLQHDVVEKLTLAAAAALELADGLDEHVGRRFRGRVRWRIVILLLGTPCVGSKRDVKRRCAEQGLVRSNEGRCARELQVA